MNTVLTKMIPGLSIDIYDFGEQLLENGTVGHKIELFSKRGDVRIPIKYESEGIIKIISILNVLMCVFNNPSMCLMIDELDAGIYKYLLGELLSVFEKGAKGQILFTSHNLRALEMLNKSSIVFSTTNPKNRYMRLQVVLFGVPERWCMIAVSSKKVILFIVEGPTDEDALSPVLKKLFQNVQVRFHVVHEDISTDLSVNSSNAVNTVNDHIKNGSLWCIVILFVLSI